MPKFLNKKVLIIFLIVLLVFILIGLAFYFLNQKQLNTISPKAEESEREKIISQQLKEIDELRQKANDQPLSREQIQKQLEELDKLRSAR